MLNVTILACLMILTGCFGLGAVDDDVIDDAEGQDAGTTIVNTYPQVQSAQLNETISLSQGESLELLTAHYERYELGTWASSTLLTLDFNCSSINGTSHLYFDKSSSVFAPSDGGACTYTVSLPHSDFFNYLVMYRVWS